MSRIENTADISASPETVWSIIADPTYFTKLLPDVISVSTEPAGVTTVGQKFHAIGKIAGRKAEFFGEATEVVPNRKLVSRQRPGGLFKSFTSSSLLEPTKKGTHVTNTFEYEVSMGYLGKILNKLVVDRSVRRNSNHYLKNLKELAELKGMPKTT